jgi:hypothetical protein
MQSPRLNPRRRIMLTSLMLALLLVRAHVPYGFMPQAGNPLQLQLCSGTLAPPVGHAAHIPDCAFSHAPATGPITLAVAANVPAATSFQFLLPIQLRPDSVRLQRAHQPRGPPNLA